VAQITAKQMMIQLVLTVRAQWPRTLETLAFCYTCRVPVTESWFVHRRSIL
jgi:hypothetical protein